MKKPGPGQTIQTFRFQKLRPHVFDSIRNSTLYFSAPSKLNDPLDCQINIAAALERAIARTTDKRQIFLENLQQTGFVERIQKDIQTMGVSSSSIELRNSLMWSHYADSHKGVCLYYEIPTEFLGPDTIHAWSPVTYGEELLTNWLINELDDGPDLAGATIEILKRVMGIKKKEWEYEKEGRLIQFESGSVGIPREFLKQICFGLETSDDDKRKMRRIVSSSYESPVHFARMIRDPDSDMGLLAIDETFVGGAADDTPCRLFAQWLSKWKRRIIGR